MPITKYPKIYKLNSVIRKLLVPIHQTYVPNAPTETIEERNSTAQTIAQSQIKIYSKRFTEVCEGHYLQGSVSLWKHMEIKVMFLDRVHRCCISVMMLQQHNPYGYKKFWESLNLQKQAQSFVEQVGFRNFWLR